MVADVGGKWAKVVEQKRWGRMWIDLKPKPYFGEPWGMDNGAYRDYVKGERFDADAFLRRVERAYRLPMPQIAVVPDLVAKGRQSLDFSLEWLDKLPPWPWYLAVQDGMTTDDVEPAIKQFRGIFLGGSNQFKGTAYYWSKLAHDNNRLFHYGRTCTWRAVQHALLVAADSADTALRWWIPGRFERVCNALDNPAGWLLEPETMAREPVEFGNMEVQP
jgi:hypothetical protein